MQKAAIFGASGGIGAALCRALADKGVQVLAGSRGGDTPTHVSITPFRFDLEDESTIAAAVQAMADDPPDLVVVATGVLTLADGTGPERSLKALDPATMQKVMLLNTIGPALIAKHVLPLFPRDRKCVFAALSAKVGSISDNRVGGWHSYRASKVALNMLIRNFAIEMERTHPQAVIVGLHPGTVDTRLSQPFQSSLPAGQLTMRRDAARNLMRILEGLQPQDSGTLVGWDGEVIAP
ncbi:SDR family oxidoreductase [Alteraurantiacibacter aestuarii]|uniref:SDR family NAD(P)-dependent oxidoreductase n=1 Tax=Alteraurantiacibacter aestuarii TaxID=650004 RepID=UPI0031DEFB5E